jgi:hypothetical protein
MLSTNPSLVTQPSRTHARQSSEATPQPEVQKLDKERVGAVEVPRDDGMCKPWSGMRGPCLLMCFQASSPASPRFACLGYAVENKEDGFGTRHRPHCPQHHRGSLGDWSRRHVNCHYMIGKLQLVQRNGLLVFFFFFFFFFFWKLAAGTSRDRRLS